MDEIISPYHRVFTFSRKNTIFQLYAQSFLISPYNLRRVSSDEMKIFHLFLEASENDWHAEGKRIACLAIGSTSRSIVTQRETGHEKSGTTVFSNCFVVKRANMFHFVSLCELKAGAFNCGPDAAFENLYHTFVRPLCHMCLPRNAIGYLLHFSSMASNCDLGNIATI